MPRAVLTFDCGALCIASFTSSSILMLAPQNECLSFGQVLHHSMSAHVLLQVRLNGFSSCERAEEFS